MAVKKVKIGSILKESRVISDKPDPNKRIKVKLKVLGVVKRGVENEVEGATKQFVRKAGQFIFGKQNFHKGAFGIVPKELDGFESSSDLPAFEIDNSCLSDYLFYFFKSGDYYLELSKIAYGVATQRINMKEFYDLEIPLPSIEKQSEIVSKLKLLENEGSKIGLELTNQLSLVKQLRQAFLSEAMQGKLVTAPSPSERAGGEAETGQQLLARIKAEKAQLIKDKKLKKEKELPPIKPEEIPFEIPEDWVWCRLGEVVLDLSYGTSEKAELSGEVPVLRMGNITTNGEVLYSNLKYVSSSIPDLPKLYLKNGDLVFNRTNSYELVGKTGVFENKQPYTLASYLIRVRFLDNINSRFVSNYINSTLCRKTQLEPQIIQQNGQANFNGTKLASILFPFPPSSIQNQIVAKLNELMKTCDDLENSIKRSQLQNEQLLQQVLKEALEVREELVD